MTTTATNEISCVAHLPDSNADRAEFDGLVGARIAAPVVGRFDAPNGLGNWPSGLDMPTRTGANAHAMALDVQMEGRGPKLGLHCPTQTQDVRISRL